jgi:hypothetical protein
MDGVDADAIGAPFAAARLAKLPVLEGSGALAGKRQTASLDQRNAIRHFVRAPMPAIEAHDERAMLAEVLEASKLALLVRQEERGHQVAPLGRLAADIASLEPIDQLLGGVRERRFEFPLLFDKGFEPAPQRGIHHAYFRKRGGQVVLCQDTPRIAREAAIAECTMSDALANSNSLSIEKAIGMSFRAALAPAHDT